MLCVCACDCECCVSVPVTVNHAVCLWTVAHVVCLWTMLCACEPCCVPVDQRADWTIHNSVLVNLFVNCWDAAWLWLGAVTVLCVGNGSRSAGCSRCDTVDGRRAEWSERSERHHHCMQEATLDLKPLSEYSAVATLNLLISTQHVNA